MTTPDKTGPSCAPVTATWNLELNCECPHCKAYVDLLQYGDFWDAHHGSLEICEHNSERSKNVEVTCPECNQDFNINCEY
jgi:hypothetical protein